MTAATGDVLLRATDVDGAGPTDCRVTAGVIAEIGPSLVPRDGELVLDGGGGALLPGLADHHLHLAATAAHDASADLTGATEVADILSAAPPDETGWIRAVGYDDGAHGDLDRYRLDAVTDAHPVRVQHRSGALWVLNSAALARVDATGSAHPGIERDHDGTPTGRLWRADHWLAEVLDPPTNLSLRDLGARLASYGVTHITDASPGSGHLDLVVSAVASGDLPQHVQLLARDPGPVTSPRLTVGPAKLVVGDHELPEFDGLVAEIAAVREEGRAVAVHCVTRSALALTLAALDAAGGPRDGDRIEHCAVAGSDLITAVAERGLRVVTQPTLVASRGDDYWDRSDPGDRPDLWPYAGLLRAGVRTAPSSDAPYGDPDPWACLRAAANRTTRSGRVLGADQRVSAADALAGLLSPLADPGGPPRRISVGEPADLVLLDRALGVALRELDPGCVRATLVAGRVVHGS